MQTAEKHPLLYTVLEIASDLETPGTVRGWEEGSLFFADFKATKRDDGTITVEDLHRSVLSRILLGPDMQVQIDE